MVDFAYSTDALNVIRDFHSTDYVVYVEGQDDLLFWGDIFRNASKLKFEIKEVGGIKELEKKIGQIIYDNANIIIACDLDHKPFLKNRTEHPRVVSTYGYSIENTLYCPCNIERVISKYARSNLELLTGIENWINNFCSNSIDLLIYDIANARYEKGISVFGDSCMNFLTSQKAISIDLEKIKNKIDKIKSKFSNTEITKTKKLIEKENRAIYLLIKGHFLTNGIINYIKNECKRIKCKNVVINPDNLFVHLVGACFDCGFQCKDKEHLLDSARNAISSLN